MTATTVDDVTTGLVIVIKATPERTAGHSFVHTTARDEVFVLTAAVCATPATPARIVQG